MGRGPTWTNEDDELLTTIILNRAQYGHRIGESIKFVAATLGRTVGSCQQRWHLLRNLNKNGISSMEEYFYEETKPTKRNPYKGQVRRSTNNEQKDVQVAEEPADMIRYRFGEYQFVAGE